MTVVAVPAWRGFAWWRAAFTWLFRSPGQFGIWVASALVATLLTSLVDRVWIIGFILSPIVWYVLFGGMMATAEKSARGRPVRFLEPLAGFRRSVGSLVGLGLATLLILAALYGVAVIIGMVAALGRFMNAWSPFEDPTLNLFALLNAVTVGWLLWICALVPLSMAVWLAPALIVLRRVGPLEAMRLSLVASWRNAGALTLYGLAFIVLAFAATLSLLLGWLVLLPLSILSVFAAYRDQFDAENEVLDAAPPGARQP
jgi:hypothetical protein